MWVGITKDHGLDPVQRVQLLEARRAKDRAHRSHKREASCRL